MDGANLVPEDAIAVFTLCNQGPAARILRISVDKLPVRHANEPRYGDDVIFGKIGSTVTLAAITTQGTDKQVVACFFFT